MEKIMVKAFKALGEPTRMKIIKMLSIQSMCVCELTEVLDMLQPRISQHLRILKEAELVKESKEGYWVYYSLDKERLNGLWNHFSDFLDADLKILEGYKDEAKRFLSLETNERVLEQKEKLKR